MRKEKGRKKLVDVRFISFTKRVGMRTKMEVTMWPLVCSPPRQVSRCFHSGKRLPAFLPIRPIIISPPRVPAQRCAATSPMSCHGQGVSHFPALDLIGCRIDIWHHLGCCPTVAAAHNISSTIATRIMELIISVLYIMRLAWLFAGAALISMHCA